MIKQFILPFYSLNFEFLEVEVKKFLKINISHLFMW